MTRESEALKKTYDQIALSGDERTTACDYNLRDLEISLASEYIRDRDVVLDAGCGLGVALRRHCQTRVIECYGLDYSENMVQAARSITKEKAPGFAIQFDCGSVAALPYSDSKFDVVTTHRCLMALLDWELQKKAIMEIHRVLKPGGVYVMMEGTIDGLDRLNFFRRKFDLPEIDADGRDRLFTRKFVEADLLSFCKPSFELVRTQRFGMYYFITRILQPLLVAPESPRYDHPINEVAKTIAKLVPDFESIGHLVGFILRKKNPLIER
jgi:ubiquinone/menaquinone biosynthesis C-methylase UbiE